MTVLIPHGYKIQGFERDGEPWIRTVPLEKGDECFHCEQLAIHESLMSGNYTIKTQEN
jgi:hypothetical protein